MNRQPLKAVLAITLSWIVFFPLALPAQTNPFNNTGIPTALVRSRVLAVDEAFALNTFIEAPDQVVLLWEIREGYYLYQQSLSVTAPGGDEIDIGELPEARTETDEYFGESNVYYDRLLHRMPLAAFPVTENTVAFTLQYQGCAKDLYCYPMQTKTIEINLPE